MAPGARGPSSTVERCTRQGSFNVEIDTWLREEPSLEVFQEADRPPENMVLRGGLCGLHVGGASAPGAAGAAKFAGDQNRSGVEM